jgi:uncharacterized protein
LTQLPLHDWRLLVAIAVIAFAGSVKSVTGLGIPMIGTPILALLYGDLPAVVVVMGIPTALASGYFVIRNLHAVREAGGELVALVPFGVVGVVAGSHLLVTVSAQILDGVLAAVILAFVANSLLRKGPPRQRARPGVATVSGFFAGALQGTSGASGPLVTMYLLRRPLSRAGFFLAANGAFLVFDVSQVLTLARLHQYTDQRVLVALAAVVPLAFGVFLGARVARHVSDELFLRSVLAILAFAGISLAVKALA